LHDTPNNVGIHEKPPRLHFAEFRAEMFDLFNRPKFTLPSTGASSTSFGDIGNPVQPIAGQAAGGSGYPREIQFALRLTG
jgi:hypothetical protein